MKHILFLLLVMAPAVLFSQDFKRKQFDYTQLKTDTASRCSDAVLAKLEGSFTALQENNSKEAVRISKDLFNAHPTCPEVYQVYGYSLFRSGEWLEGIDVIEQGLEKFGTIPELIKRRSEMSLEMAELGTTQKNIDGNAVFKADGLTFPEEQFKEENLRSALTDLEYLVKTYNRNEEVFYVAKVYQLLKDYERSTGFFQMLLNDAEYKSAAVFNLADNYTATSHYAKAEAEIAKLLKEFPKEGELYEKLAGIHALKKDTAKQAEFHAKALFFSHVPACTDLDYSQANADLLLFFASEENKADKKRQKLKDLYQQGDQNYTIDVCLMVLQLHANHGNGVEDEATRILATIGRPTLDKVHQMFGSNVSTCTITNLASIMATVKDEKSWELLVQYLPNIAHMPMTLTPPAVPAMLVQFDEEKGLREILRVVKPLLSQNSDDEDALSGFGQFVYYMPLQKISKSRLKKMAAELSYTDAEFNKLLEQLK